ncbi:hypothetical protein PUNSTDRAFT_67511, partial [Punctularia strigosozonata HHB-11173 SS5]|uniref:uncharacterized protein n=1 Tax=Punctularia strigosozonata (strain HHB-11173) TaxID=741275 RepID=UPI0004416EED
QFWGDRMPESLSSGQVVLQGHDFFAPQSAQNTDASLFVLRMVLHDWPASKATAILRHLRAASTPHRTKLLVVENMPRYACRGSTAGTGEDGEDQGAAVPEPLLGNGGYAAAMAYLMDLQMMLIDGHERTIGDFRRITADSGWKIVRVYSPSGQSVNLSRTTARLNSPHDTTQVRTSSTYLRRRFDRLHSLTSISNNIPNVQL